MCTTFNPIWDKCSNSCFCERGRQGIPMTSTGHTVWPVKELMDKPRGFFQYLCNNRDQFCIDAGTHDECARQYIENHLDPYVPTCPLCDNLLVRCTYFNHLGEKTIVWDRVETTRNSLKVLQANSKNHHMISLYEQKVQSYDALLSTSKSSVNMESFQSLKQECQTTEEKTPNVNCFICGHDGETTTCIVYCNCNYDEVFVSAEFQAHIECFKRIDDKDVTCLICDIPREHSIFHSIRFQSNEHEQNSCMLGHLFNPQCEGTFMPFLTKSGNNSKE